MKNDGISQSEPRKLKIDEAKVCQLVAVLKEMWPDLSPVKPELKVVPSETKTNFSNLCSDPVVVDSANHLLRENLPEEFKREVGAYEFARSDEKAQAALTTRSAEHGGVIRFPRARKRGAKVRTGPCARVIPLPGNFIGEDLDKRFEFTRKYASDWQTDDPDGVSEIDWHRRLWIEGAFESLHKRPMTDHDKRTQVVVGRARIDTRNRVKAYLERRGVDLDKIRNAEEALFALFGLVEAKP